MYTRQWTLTDVSIDPYSCRHQRYFHSRGCGQCFLTALSHLRLDLIHLSWLAEQEFLIRNSAFDDPGRISSVVVANCPHSAIRYASFVLPLHALRGRDRACTHFTLTCLSPLARNTMCTEKIHQPIWVRSSSYRPSTDAKCCLSRAEETISQVRHLPPCPQASTHTTLLMHALY